jgi:hypothetical protein
MAKLLTGTRIYGTGTVDTQLFVSGTTPATSTITGALQIVGGVGVGGNLYVGGISVLNGVQSTNIVASGTLGVTGTSTLRVVNATSATFSGTLGVTGTSVLNGLSATNIVASGTLGVTGTSTLAGLALVINTTSATSTNTGALQVVGGVGIGGDLRVGGIIYGTFNGSITGTATTATNIAGGTAGQVLYQTAPGATSFVSTGTAGNVLVSNGSSAPTYNNTLTLTGTTNATSTTTGALQVRGGVGVGGDLWVGGGNVTLADDNGSNMSTLEIDSFFPRFNIKTRNPSFSYPANPLISHSDENGTVWTIGSIAQGGDVNTTSTLYINVFKPFNYSHPPSAGDTVFAGNGSPNLRISFNGTTTIYNTSISVSTLTGALVVAGGVGIGRSLFVQENIVQVGGTYSTLAATYNLINTTATIVNFAGAASALTIGATTGSTTVRNNLSVTGNLTVQGTTTIVDSTVTNIADPIITLGGGTGNTAPTADDNKDRGVAFKWVNNGGTTSTGFFGYDDSTGFLTYIQTATITNEVVSGTKGAVDANLAGGAAMSLVYQSAANTTAFLAAGTGGFILQTNGTGSAPTWVSASGIGAGSATNADAVRTIERTTAAAHFLTFVDSNNATNAYESLYTTSSFVINPQSGNVGIGTSSPEYGLHLGSNSVSKSLAFTIDNPTQADIIWKYIGQSKINAKIGSVGSGSFANKGLAFYTTDSQDTTTDAVERLRITESGNVGIGTSSPTQKLEVFTGAGYITANTNDGVGSAGGFGYQLRIASTGHVIGQLAGLYTNSGAGGSGGITISTRNSGTIAERLRIDPTGNVFINAVTELNTGFTNRLNVNGGIVAGTAQSTNGSIILQGLYGTGAITNFGTEFSSGGPVIGYGVYPSNTATGVFFSSSGAALNRGAYTIAGNSHNWYIGGAQTLPIGSTATLSLAMSLTSTGALAFNGAANFGSAGQVLQSNGNAPPTWVPVSGTTVGTSTQVITVARTTNASHFLTFVDSNNASATAEAVYTTSSFSINPATGNIGIGIGPNSTYKLAIANTLAGAQADKTLFNISDLYNAGVNGQFFKIMGGPSGINLLSGWGTLNLGARVADGNDTFTSHLTINGSGNVGIGTLTPGAPLAFADSLATKIQFNGNNANGYTVGLSSAVNSGDAMMRFTAGAIGAGEIGFYNTTNLRLLINNVGNVGIGTSTPQYRLDVNNGTLGSNSFQASFGSNISAGNWTGIHFGYSEAANTLYRKSALVFERQDSSARGKVHILNNGTNGSASATLADARLTITFDGNVGVGTTNPINKFEVAGTAGQLFSVSDSFTGTIFSVNDVSGIPSIEVLDTGLVKMAQYSGQVAISTSTAAVGSALTVFGTISTLGPTGEIRASNEITAYFSSDARLKENVTIISNPIEMVKQIRGVYFDWTDEHIARRGGEDGYFVRKHDVGVIAQEVEQVLPEVVGTREDGFKAVKYDKIVALLVEAVKEQQQQIDELKKLLGK